MIDLHTHSCFSDGTDTPTDLVKLAQRQKLEAIALCDHNTVAGLPEFTEAGKDSPVETVPGAELTAEYNQTELHILALFISPEHYNAVNRYVETFRCAKNKSNRQLFDALTEAGFRLEEDRIFQGSKDYVNRAIFASELTRLGYTPSIEVAFQTILSPRNSFYTPAPRPAATDTIRFIRSIGAVPVLAHPLDSMEERQLKDFLPKAVSAGLAAMETYYSKYDTATTSLSCRLAKDFGLLECGGSDYHGTRKPGIPLGGNLSIPYSVLETLKLHNLIL